MAYSVLDPENEGNPQSRDELSGAAQTLKTAMSQQQIYDAYGPMVIYNELFEGAAVIESQPHAVRASQYHALVSIGLRS